MNADPSRARTICWETLRCFLTPVDAVGLGGYEEAPPGPLALEEIGAMLVEVATFVEEPLSGSGRARAKLSRQRLA